MFWLRFSSLSSCIRCRCAVRCMSRKRTAERPSITAGSDRRGRYAAHAHRGHRRRGGTRCSCRPSRGGGRRAPRPGLACAVDPVFKDDGPVVVIRSRLGGSSTIGGQYSPRPRPGTPAARRRGAARARPPTPRRGSSRVRTGRWSERGRAGHTSRGLLPRPRHRIRRRAGRRRRGAPDRPDTKRVSTPWRSGSASSIRASRRAASPAASSAGA